MEPQAPERTPVVLRVTGWSLVRGVLIVASGLVLLGVAAAASTVLWWLAIATAVAAAFHPVVMWLRRWMPGWVAILLVLVAGMAFVGLVGYRGIAELADQYQVMRANALAAAESVASSPQFGEVATEFGLVEKTTDLFDALPGALTGNDVDDAAATVQSAASSGSALFAVATFAVLMLIFGSRFVDAGLAQIDDPEARRKIGELVISSYVDSYRYVWLMVARAIVIGVVGGLACAALDLETPTALGVAFAALSFIPGLGIVLAAAPVAAYLAALSSPSTGIAFITVAAVVQAVEAGTVQRWINEATVQVGPTATLVAVLLGLQLYGLGGSLAGLATAVFGLAVLRRLSEAHDEIFTAVRQLMREPPERQAPAEVEGDEAP
jgi:predicted PurR-regulated permease PerM